MEKAVELKIAHLAMLQAVIARMAGNSFALKTLSVTIATGVVALVGALRDPDRLYLLAGLLPVLVFWWMDASYLQLERQYRELYDKVRTDADVPMLSMNASKYRAVVPSVARTALSWSVLPVYLILILIFFFIGYLQASAS